MPIVRALGAIVVLVLPSGDSVSKPDVDEGLDVAELVELTVLLELEELCVVAGVGDTDEPELEAVGLDVCVSSPGVLVGGNVTPAGRKYTSSRNTAPIRSSYGGGKFSSSAGLNRYEKVTSCSPGESSIPWFLINSGISLALPCCVPST